MPPLQIGYVLQDASYSDWLYSFDLNQCFFHS